MSEETEKTDETQETQGTQGTQGTQDTRAALTEKDDRIAELELNLTQLQSNLDATQDNMVTLNEAAAAATEKYLEAQRNLHPDLPADLVKGATIEEIDESVKAGLTVVDAVKANLANEAKNNRVPAGAPTREVDLEALTAEEKIKLGLAQQKGGTS